MNEPQSVQHTFPIIWAKAKGCYVWDDTGKRYLDFSSGIFVTNTGHSNDHVREAINEQLNNNLLFAYLYPTSIRHKFTSKLLSMCPNYLSMCALYSEGAIANEHAIQIAKAYTGKKRVLKIKGNYHGSTHYLSNLKVGFKFPKENSKFIKPLRVSNIAAIIIEGYQGWSARFYPDQWIHDLAKWCKWHDILLIFDEIQSGFYRTGPLFAFLRYGIEPDLVTFGKAVSGSLPLSGIIGKPEIMKVFDNKSFISTTHSGNCLALAAGLANLEELEKLSKPNIIALGCMMMVKLDYLKKKYPALITEVTGKGLVAAIHFVNDEITDKIAYQCNQNGLMTIRTHRITLKIGPPLIITEDQLMTGINIIDKSIGDVLNEAR